MKHTYTIAGGIFAFVIISTIVSANISENPEKTIAVKDNSGSSISGKNVNKTKTLTGTWVKEKIHQEDHYYPGDKNLQLTVTFDADRHFIWNLKHKNESGKIIEESFTGTFTIEKGFLISYHFDKHTNLASKWIPELFAFWPNKRLGQQTFRFGEDYLRLGHDGHKTWIYLKADSGK